ncbi:hypothetical protein BH11BAC5_BH11BAC5_22260 [soil metagenome]
MKSRTLFAACFVLIIFSTCRQATSPEALNKFCENKLPEWNGKLTQVIIQDIFSPAVCSRIYAYANIAAYEGLRPQYSYPTYAGRLHDLTQLPLAAPGHQYSYPVASIIAFTTVAQKMVFSGGLIVSMEKDFLKQLDSLNVNKALLDSSVSYGRQVGNHILAWAGKDGYLERNALPAYIVTKEAGRYQPTPPTYTDAIETNWKMIRTFVLDSAAQFRPPPPIPYDTTKNSAFYKETYKVYDAVKNPAAGDSATAWYWDDNPNTSVTNGHVTYFQQKNSPPGHWVFIAGSVAEKEKFDPAKTASLISATAIAMADAFISCWEAKYVYNYIRPETFINNYIDKDWLPLIQTPAFPEYPSGHSVASAAAATVLTKMVGANYGFTDSAEVPYGRPTRKFDSFYQASDQASTSRFYGGIHFMNALEKGMLEGRSVGNFVLLKLK